MWLNAGECSRSHSEAAASRANVKRPRGGEVNFLPNYPHGETKDALETKGLDMVEQFKRTSIVGDTLKSFLLLTIVIHLSSSHGRNKRQPACSLL